MSNDDKHAPKPWGGRFQEPTDAFVERFTATNRGRAYYSGLGKLGDFLLVDYRGTGKSNPLFCPYQEEMQQGISEALETFLPVDLLDGEAVAPGAQHGHHALVVGGHGDRAGAVAADQQRTTDLFIPDL